MFLKWKDTNPEELSDTKLRCVFEFPLDNTNTNTASVRQDTSKFDFTPFMSKNDLWIILFFLAALINHEASATDPNQGSGDEKVRKILDGASDMDKASAEMRQLREEESQLRQENLQLKVKY